MLADVIINRDLPIIAGAVQVPPNFASSKNSITVAKALQLIPGSYVVELSIGSGRSTGANFGAQRWLRIPGQPIDCCHIWAPDPAATLATPNPGPPTFAAF